MIIEQNTKLEALHLSKKEKMLYQKAFKHIGEVYAVVTKKGYAIAQVCGIERHGIEVCRIFSTLYPYIPTLIHELITQKEDYICVVPIRMLSRAPMKKTILLGNYAVPKNFQIPIYTRWCSQFRGTRAPFQHWIIYKNYTPRPISLEDYIRLHLKKKLTDLSWQEEFLKLSPACILNGRELIEKLESHFSLQNWKPADFKLLI